MYLCLFQALETHLQVFGINDLISVNILCDRGSNFVKAFRDYDPLFCFRHRLNNILKTSSFQNTKKNKKHCSISTIDIAKSLNNSILTNAQLDTVSNANETVSSEESDEDEDVVTSIPVIRKRKQCILKQKDDHQQLLAKTSVDTIPAEAKVVLITLSQCKKNIKFIKKVNF